MLQEIEDKKIKNIILLICQSIAKYIISGAEPTENIARKPKTEAAKQLKIITVLRSVLADK